MKHLLPLLILCAVCLACMDGGPSNSVSRQPSGVFAPSNKSNLESKVIARIGKIPKKWESVYISKLDDNMITMYLEYRDMPESMNEVSMDTKRIARAALEMLMAEGYKPRESSLALFVHAQRRESGETGGDMVRRFGKTMYDFNSDTLEFEPVTK